MAFVVKLPALPLLFVAVRLFGAKNRRVHLLMTACAAVMVTSVLVLLFELQYPFRTGLRIAPTTGLP
jgi:hypothetical protein